MDPDKALAVVVEFRERLNIYENPRGAAEHDQVSEWLDKRRPLVVEIAETAQRGLGQLIKRRARTSGVGWTWSSAHTPTLTLIGALEDSSLRQEVLGPQGPLLSARNLHPWVWHSAVDLWDDGRWRHAA